MNGIGMDNPFALLMNMNIGVTSPDASLLNPSAAAQGFDLLEFVNTLAVTQGPTSPTGEELDGLADALAPTDIEIQKKAEIAMPTSDEVVQAMVSPVTNQQMWSTTSSDPLKTAIQNDVGHPGQTKLEQSSKPILTTGDTGMAGDLSELMLSPRSMNRLPMSTTEPLAQQDVAVWSQAFAQNDIESMELEPQLAALSGRGASELASEDMLRPMGAKGRESSALVGGKVNAPVAEAAGFQAWQPAKVEATTLPEAPQAVESFALRSRKESSKSSGEQSSVGADFLLDRQIASTTAGIRPENGALQSAETLGLNGDARLNADSVKMLADKIETLKSQGSSTLRVVVSPDDMGRVEIRVQKIGGEIKVQLSSDSSQITKALEDSKAELMTHLANRTKVTSIEIGMEIQKTTQDSVVSLSLKNALPSTDVLKLGGHEARMNGSNMDFSGDSQKFSQGQPSEQQRQQGQREESRDRGMRQWQDVFEGRQSA